MKTFESLGLSQNLVSALKENEFFNPTEIQERAIPILLKNQDLVGLSQTGTGKTLAFALPLIQKTIPQKFVQSLIICPTRELAEQILLEFKKLCNCYYIVFILHLSTKSV